MSPGARSCCGVCPLTTLAVFSSLPESWEGDEELLFDLASVFGRLTLIVPTDCVVVNEGVLVFGCITDQRLGVDAGKSLVVRLRGVSLFAHVNILAKLSPEAKEAATKYGLAQIGTITSYKR